MKIILKIFVVLIFIIIFLVGYLSFIGFETTRFNNHISKSIKSVDSNFKIDLKEIKIVLDPLKLNLNAKTIGPKLINRNETIEIEYLKTQIPISSIFTQKFFIKNLEISTKSLKIKNLISFSRKFKNTAELYVLENIVKKGFVIADIKINFDESGKIINNFKINGVLKDTNINILKKYNVNNLNLLFNYDQNILNLYDLEANFNNIKFVSEKLNIQNLNNEFEIKGDLENKSLNLNNDNIELFIKPYFKNLNIKKVKFSSKNTFSFKIDKKFKFHNFNSKTKLKLQEFSFLNDFKLKKFFPKIKKEIKILNHDIEINYGKAGVKLTGKGDILLQKNIDEISYLINNKDKGYDFSTLVKFKDNPISIDFLNYKKKIDKEMTLSLKGNKKIDGPTRFDLISIIEKDNKIKIESLILDNKLSITNLKKADLNYFDKENIKNQFSLIKKNNIYYLEGFALNGDSLIQNLVDEKESKSNIINKNFTLNVNLDELILDQNYKLNNLKGDLSFDNQKIINGNLIGFFSESEKMKFTVKTIGQEKITTLFLDQAEPMVSRYKFIKGFNRGTLDFYSSKNGDLSTSTLKIYDFNLKELPVLTKILTLASLQGIADILTGEGISFDEFEMNFTNKKNLMKIEEIYAIGPAISILMRGYIEKNKIVSLRGTLVPATTINKAIGSIPVLGQILVGSKTGEGVFGVSFKIKGPPKNLETTVNPIKTLTPRFITRTLENIKKKN